MQRKKKKKSDDIIKDTIIINHSFNSNISKILDKLGNTSKFTFNHYIFCYKFYLLYKDIVYDDVLFQTFKTKKFKCDDINILIKNTFNHYYSIYQNDFQKYISNNNILFQYIKNLKININHTNFMTYYNLLVFSCVGLDKLDISNKNLLFLYEKNIYTILYSFYCWKYYNVQNSLINKKPIKANFDDEFKSHVMTTDKPINFISNNIKYKEILSLFTNEQDKSIISERNIIARICYHNINFTITSSDIVVNTINKAYDCMSSYYALKSKGLKANKPNYLTDYFYSLIFCGKTKKIEDKNIRLLYGDEIYKNWFELFNENIESKPQLKIKKPNILKNKNYELKQIEIKKIYGNNYKVLYTLDKKIKPLEEIKKVKLSETISIDLGLKNLFTIHDPSGKQLILKGGYLISLNEYYNKKIAKVQSLRDKMIDNNKKEKYNNEILHLLNIRERKINGMMNKIVNKLKTLYPTKKLIIIGYNEGWKQNLKLGTDTNRKFYQIPYKKLLKKIKYAFKENAIIEEINEAYTSKCDALGLETIERHDEYLGNRIKRGLFSSSVNKLINADLNGAINIMRKYMDGNYINIKGLHLCNPERINL